MVGAGWNGLTIRAFIWSEPASFTYLPGLEGGPADRVLPGGISGDDTVTGRARSGETRSWHAFIKDAQSGMQNLDALDVGQPANFRMERAGHQRSPVDRRRRQGRPWLLSLPRLCAHPDVRPGCLNGGFVFNFADLNLVLSSCGAACNFSDLNLVHSSLGQNCPAN